MSYVKPSGPADTAGLRVGDAIISLEGQRVADLGLERVQQYLQPGSIGVGRRLTFALARGNTVTITAVR